MEETWNSFYQSGKVTDYLDYCKERDEGTNGRVSGTDRDGTDSHANQ